jgi:thiamine transporter
VNSQRIRIIAEIALTIALAAVLNMAKIWRMPNAGTVSFVMLPLIVLSLRRGAGVGVLAGALYGVVDMFIDPFPPVTLLQPILDYPLAYGLVGLSGLVAVAWKSAFARSAMVKATGWVVMACTIAAVGRYAAHVISGALFFAQYAPKGQSPWVYSAIYNLYVPVSAALAAVAASVLLPALERAVPSAAPATEES